MAVVRFSEELKDAIITNAKAFFEPRIKAMRDQQPNVFDAVAAQAYSTYMPGINALPMNFFNWSSDIEIDVKYKTTIITIYGKTSTPYPRLHDGQKAPCGAVIKGSYRIDIALPTESSVYAPYNDQVIAWYEGIEAVSAQRDEFVDGVRQVIDAHSTLAPALKAWPPLWDLVPETYKERHRKVVERNKPAPELDVDLSKLTTTVVAAKITNR